MSSVDFRGILEFPSVALEEAILPLVHRGRAPASVTFALIREIPSLWNTLSDFDKEKYSEIPPLAFSEFFL